MEERSYFRAGFKPHEWGLDTVTRPQASQLGLWDDRSAPKGANSKKVEAERLGGRARPSVSPQGLLQGRKGAAGLIADSLLHAHRNSCWEGWGRERLVGESSRQRLKRTKENLPFV